MNTKINELYKKITERKVILFLGAGASLTEKRGYLSKHLIEYYRDLRNIPYEPENNDIVDFVDKVFSLPQYDRKDFDYQISLWFRNNLKPTEYQNYCISLPWLSVISTNIDLLVEEIILKENLSDNYEVIRNLKEFNASLNHGDKCKYVKLHGCISELSKYPLLFSSNDFNRNDKYYNRIFSIIEEQSPEVGILFLGYSFKDRFGNLFLNSFQERFQGREFYMVDPYLSDDDFSLEYYKSKNIVPIKKSFEEFINNYKDWYVLNKDKFSFDKANMFFNSEGINLNRQLQEKIRPFMIPLNNTYTNEFIDAKNYYLGKEPNFNVIKANYDVIKQNKIIEVGEEVKKLFANKSTSYPFVFLTGSYGTGKSTFTYRLIKSLLDTDENLLAFEIIDLQKIDFTLICTLIQNLNKTERIIIYSDQSEQDLNFSKLRELRGYLSSMQFEDKSIILLQSIRENNLEKYKKRLKPNIDEINIDCELSKEELTLLVEKFFHNKLINYTSEKEKRELIDSIQNELKINDQLLLSLFLIKNGRHSKYILDTYDKFEFQSTKKAFLYTCLLYQYGIKMPISLLNSIIGTDWENFINEIIKVDGKGIFIQENLNPDFYLKTDLYFKVKHKIIAEIFIKEKIKSNKIYSNYLTLTQNLPENDESIYVFVNLIKKISDDRVLDESKINHLYDLAYNKLKSFTRFVIYYTRNLQHRNSKSECLKALEILEEAEGYNYDNGGLRDKFIIHRRACLNYELAKLHYENNKTISLEYLNEAIELFEIKEAIDPNSIFSYKQFIELLVWYLRKWDLDDYLKTKTELKIHSLLNKGINNVTEGINQLINIKEQINNRLDILELSERIDRLIEDVEQRPLALILKYQLLVEKKEEFDKEKLVEEIENFSYNEEVAFFLFNYYGEVLYSYENRMKFFKLIRQNKSIEEKEKLNYLYYCFVAESYNYRFNDAFAYQKEITSNFRGSLKKNPIYWQESEGIKDRIFEGKVIKNKRGFYDLKLVDFGYNLNVKLNGRSNDFSKLVYETLYVKLYFTYTGIWAELLEEEQIDK